MGNVFGVPVWVLRAKLKKSMDNFEGIVAYVVRCVLVLFPAIFAYFTLMLDTYSTAVGINAYGLVESNPMYAHYNQKGVGAEDLFKRQILATEVMLLFILVGAAVLTGKKPVWFWGVIYIIMWVVLLIDLITVYSNILQIVSST